jgi:hypothetical protein
MVVNCFTYIARGKGGAIVKEGYITCGNFESAREIFNKTISPTLKDHTSTVFMVTKCDFCKGTYDVIDFLYNRREYVLCWNCRSCFLNIK